MKMGRMRLIAGHMMIRLAAFVFAMLPLKLSFAVVVVARHFRIPGQTALTLGLLPAVAKKRRAGLHNRFGSRLTRRLLSASVSVLFELRAFQEITELLGSNSQVFASRFCALMLRRSYFELGDLSKATETLIPWWPDSRCGSDAVLAENIALDSILTGDETRAGRLMKLAAIDMPHLMRPHQNMAARQTGPYTPTSLDIAAGTDGLLFDMYNLLGQRVTHVGEGSRCAELYAGALRVQGRLHERLVTSRQRRAPSGLGELQLTRPTVGQKKANVGGPCISPELEAFLLSLNTPLKDLKVLPNEWVTQIGHLGMIDMLLRMRTLGWWGGTPVVLAPTSYIANKAFLSLYGEDLTTLVPSANISEELAAELVSLQRYCGMNFNAFKMPDGTVLPFQDAGAMAMRLWDEQGRAPPLIERYDAMYGNVPTIRDLISGIKAKWGMKPDDWYVCLHMRDASYYKETAGTGQSHRNSRIDSYVQTIRDITARGGWVVKLGGAGSPKLPKIPRLIDYARSDDKSELVDLDLIRHCRFFIGTTSGLTNVAVSFGRHCALVNCITTDAQLWSDRVCFALKPVRMTDGRMIRQDALSGSPGRWRMFSAETLAHHGAMSFDNSDDEVLETARETEAVAMGQGNSYAATIPDAEGLTRRWKRSVDTPHFYGGARPSLYYLNKYHHEFLSEDGA